MNLLQEKKIMSCWKFTAGRKLLFIGDSITDAFRLSHPDGPPRWLEAGYVAVVDAALANLRPGAAPEVVNRGVSGNRVSDLRERWREDVVAEKPNWLSVMIGINDVWRQFESPELPDQVSPDRIHPTLTGHMIIARAFLQGGGHDWFRGR